MEDKDSVLHAFLQAAAARIQVVDGLDCPEEQVPNGRAVAIVLEWCANGRDKRARLV